MHSLNKLLAPKSIAVIGGGLWCEAVIEQNKKFGFAGEIWPIHPTRSEIACVKAFPSLAELPAPPDAAFVGVNRHATIDVVAELGAMGAGGAVCFASGFKEADDGAMLSEQLLDAANAMPLLGPNCYGLINALDQVSLWPDQHGLRSVDSGVAIIMQSSNIALNITMQKRGLPITHLITVGNQTQLGLADVACQLLHDEKVTALGLYVESFGDIRAFEALAKQASSLNKPIAVLKVGMSEQAQRATVTHTASMAGSTAGSEAFMARLGMASVPSIGVFLETLKIFHCFGTLPGPSIASLSCSGGEASVMADSATQAGLKLPALNDAQTNALRKHLSPLVQLANPLDYHTHIWRDKAAMTNVFAAVSGGDIDLTLIVLDFPRLDNCDASDWDIVIDSVIDAATKTGRRYGVVSSMPENMPEDVAIRLLHNGMVPLCDFDHACCAILAASSPSYDEPAPLLFASRPESLHIHSEAEAKSALADAGMDVPKCKAGLSINDLGECAFVEGELLVLKGENLAHKTESGAVALNLSSHEDLLSAAREMSCDSFLVEEMVTDCIAELLLGVVYDPAHGFVLTIAAGGTLAELIEDKQHLLVPASKPSIEAALSKLKIGSLLDGYRGGPVADKVSIIDAIMKLQSYVIANRDRVVEIEINPLICTSTRAVVADALLVKGDV